MSTEKDDRTFLALGREIVRMIHDVRKVAKDETGYARRTFTFPGGEVQIFVVNNPKLADLFDAAAAKGFNVQDATPPSTRN